MMEYDGIHQERRDNTSGKNNSAVPAGKELWTYSRVCEMMDGVVDECQEERGHLWKTQDSEQG